MRLPAPPRALLPLLPLLAASVPACSASRPTAAASPVRPLAGIAARPLLVLPVRYVTFPDTGRLGPWLGSVTAYRTALDDEIAFALGERGLRGRWTFAPDVERAARRGAGTMPDPRELDARQLRRGARTDAWQLGEPLATQLRSLVALTEARLVLYPVELVLAADTGGTTATLHAVLVDARRSQVAWSGDVVARAPAGAPREAVAAAVASRLADLVAPVGR